MITELTLRNFKCFREVSISPKLVTILIGPNGTGKSSVLQALCLLKQWETRGSTLPLDGRLLQLSPDEFVNQSVHPGSAHVELAISGVWGLADQTVESPVEFELCFVFDGTGETISKTSNVGFVLRGEPVTVTIPSILGHGRSEVVVGSTEVGYVGAVSGTEIGDLRILNRFSDYGSSLRSTLRCVRSLLKEVRVVPAIRGLARRTYSLGPAPHDEILPMEGLSAQEDALVTTLAYAPAEVLRIADWMKRVTGVGLQTELVPGRNVQPTSTTRSGQRSLLAEGFGTNALVLLLLELSRSSDGATILIEEPEIHLHPGAQAELASVITGEAKASNKQVIMTTHSEHIAGRLMIEVAEGNLSPEDIAIYSFEKDDNGVCSASEIEVSENGQVAGGLRSFFQTDLDEMRRYVDALRAKA